MEYSKKAILIFTVLLFAAGSLCNRVHASEQRVYDLTLSYDKGAITKKSLVVTIGVFTSVLNQPADGYHLELKSFDDDKVLYSEKFSFDLIGQQISIQGQKPFAVEDDERELVFPYFPNGKEIDIYDSKNTKILTIPVQQFAEVTPSSTAGQVF